MKKFVGVVTFPDTKIHSSAYGKKYNFLTDIQGLKVGDKLVVDTQNGITIAEFVAYDALGFGETGVKAPTKWIIQKVDMEAHEARVKAAKDLEKLKVQMEARRKQAEEISIYRILAKEDPEMAKLLEEYEKAQEVL